MGNLEHKERQIWESVGANSAKFPPPSLPTRTFESNCLSVGAASVVLNRPCKDVLDLVDRKMIYAFRGENDALLFPNFQFAGTKLLRNLKYILVKLSPSVSPMVFTHWMTTRSSDLQGLTPVLWLQTGGGVHILRELMQDIQDY